MNEIKDLTKWWEENYDKKIQKNDMKILTLPEKDFDEFLLKIENKEALRNLCAFIYGALLQRREVIKNA